jgi:hypothetical protein
MPGRWSTLVALMAVADTAIATGNSVNGSSPKLDVMAIYFGESHHHHHNHPCKHTFLQHAPHSLTHSSSLSFLPLFFWGLMRRLRLFCRHTGDWHSDPDMAGLHGPNWTEWGLVTNAQPRFEGHQQPNLPLDQPPGWGISAAENTPEAMKMKIDAAVQHGVTSFLFDW